MCQLFKVKRSSYYHWAKKKDDDIYPLHSEMFDWVKKIEKGAENLYGSRRMKHAVNCLGFAISRQKTRKLMNEAGVWVKYRKKYKVTTDSNHNKPLFDNLVKRQFDIGAEPDLRRGHYVYLVA
ncbi:MAG: putative transposase [Francisellaceae bacterium]|jgi:putative transposase